MTVTLSCPSLPRFHPVGAARDPGRGGARVRETPCDARRRFRGPEGFPRRVGRNVELDLGSHRALPRGDACPQLDPGLGEDLTIPQRIECLAFTEGHHHVLSPVVTKVRLGAVDAVIFSEIVLELKDVLASTSSGEERSLPSIPTNLD